MEKNEKTSFDVFKDLCCRLPYGVYVLVHDTFEYSTVLYETVYLKSSDTASLIDSISLNERYSSKNKRFNRIIEERKDFLEFKSYLRPMSSMTEEERKEFCKIEGRLNFPCKCIKLTFSVDEFDWLNKHHFDYHGLIEKGLALEAPEGMYK